VVAEAGDALVVAFLGTKRAADHLVNLRLRHAPVLHRGKAPAAEPVSGGGGGGEADGSSAAAAPSAHAGYLGRSLGIPVEQLYRLARGE
jgi:hypothetical protein